MVAKPMVIKILIKKIKNFNENKTNRIGYDR